MHPPGEKGRVVLRDAEGMEGGDSGRHFGVRLGEGGFPHSTALDVGKLQQHLRGRFTTLPLELPGPANGGALRTVQQLVAGVVTSGRQVVS